METNAVGHNYNGIVLHVRQIEQAVKEIYFSHHNC